MPSMALSRLISRMTASGVLLRSWFTASSSSYAIPDTVKSALLRYMEIFSAMTGSSSIISIFDSLILILLLVFVQLFCIARYAFPRRRHGRCRSTISLLVSVQRLLSVLYQRSFLAASKDRAGNRRRYLSLSIPNSHLFFSASPISRHVLYL